MKIIQKPKFRYFVNPETTWMYHAVPTNPVFQADQYIPVFITNTTLCGVPILPHQRATHIKPLVGRCDTCAARYVADIHGHIGNTTTGVYINRKSQLGFYVGNRVYRVSTSTHGSRNDTIFSLRIINVEDRSDKFQTRGYPTEMEAWQELGRRIPNMDDAYTTSLFDTDPYLDGAYVSDESHLAMFN